MAGGSEVQPQSRDAFGLIGTGAETLLMRGLLDAQSILSGPAIQARCLECPASTTPLRKKEKATLSAWLAGLFAR
jgi:protease-4